MYEHQRTAPVWSANKIALFLSSLFVLVDVIVTIWSMRFTTAMMSTCYEYECEYEYERASERQDGMNM